MDKKNMFKKIVITGLTLAMIVGGAGSAFADGKGSGNHGKGKADHKIETKIEINLDFSDVDEKKLAWAFQHIAKLASMGVFNGYQDGTFKPNAPIKRIDAIVAAVRLMGLKEIAESKEKMATELNFKDGDRVENKFPYAVGYVAVALENDLFSETESSIQPERPADRLWATTLLVKALKLDAEAMTKMNTELTFKDAHQIPAGSVGYVAVAVEKGLITGYNNNTFQPNKPVTRAEIAALLDRAGEQLPGEDTNFVRGTVSAVNGNQLTIQRNGQLQQLTLDTNAVIFKNGVKVTAADLSVGDKLLVRVYNNVAYYVEVTGAGEVENNTFSGTVNQAVNSNVLKITRNGQTIDYAVDANADIYINDLKANSLALQAGDEVTVTVDNNNVVKYIKVTKLAEVATDYNGTVSAAATNNVLSITKTGQSQSQPLVVDSNAFIYRNGVKVNASALVVGDEVFVRTRNNTIVFIQVKQIAGTTTTFNATLNAAVTNNIIILTQAGQSTAASYVIDANADIYINSLKVKADALQSGDQITVQLQNNVVKTVTVTSLSQASANITGLVNEVPNAQVLIVSKDNVNSPYVLGTNAAIYRNEVKVNASDLRVGDEIYARVYNNVIVYVQVTRLVENNQFTVNGTFNSVGYTQLRISSISITQTVNGTAQTSIYNVSADATIIGNADLLVPGHAVELKGMNQLVTSIEVK